MFDCMIKIIIMIRLIMVGQGSRSCAKARRALAEKFGLTTKILSTNKRYFVAILRFVAIYALFGRPGQKSAFWGQQQCFLGKKCIITYFILHIILN